MKNVYIIGSLRNSAVTTLANEVEALGFEVFSDWMSAGPTADDSWQAYETARGRTYEQALQGYSAKHVFEYDVFHLNRADIAVLLLPAGKSGHLELGIHLGRGKPGYILFEQPVDRWDVMVQFATAICFSRDQLFERLKHDFSLSSESVSRQADTNQLRFTMSGCGD